MMEKELIFALFNNCLIIKVLCLLKTILGNLLLSLKLLATVATNPEASGLGSLEEWGSGFNKVQV